MGDVSTTYAVQGPVPLRPISANPGLKFCSLFVFTFLLYALLRVTFVLSYFASSSYMFLDKKTMLKIWLK